MPEIVGKAEQVSSDRVPEASMLTCDYQAEPIGIGSGHPLLRWNIAAGGRPALQSAYRVTAASSQAGLSRPDLWDSGEVLSDKPAAIYDGKPPVSGQRVYWRVRIRDGSGAQGPWSGTACWRQGIGQSDWTGVWIGNDSKAPYIKPERYFCADDYDKGQNQPHLPAPCLFRSEFTLDKGWTDAVLYVSALGLTEVYINDARATSGRLIPGLCDYSKRAYYFAYDVSGLLKKGANAIGAVLADGWYAGYIGLNPREYWGSKPRLNLELHIRSGKESLQRVVTGKDWKTGPGPWLYGDIMHGEGYDASREQKGWADPGFDDSLWRPADTGAEFSHVPSAHPGVPIIEHERIPAASIRQLPEGQAIIDFGQCFAGVVSLTLIGPAGARIDIRHAEELQDGGLYLRGNRSAQAHDCYILKGQGVEVFSPRFTYHGFRYAQVSGLSGVTLLSAQGIALGSFLPGKTAFESGNGAVNAALDMIVRTQMSNQVDVPTDVCARDERLGWGAEGHFFMHTASWLNFNALFLRKWMRDIADSQAENGCFWANAPAVRMADVVPFAGDIQSDMGLHVCWLLMTMYDDVQTVRAYFPALERHFAWQLGSNDRLVRFATGRDWLDITRGGRSDGDHGYGTTSPGLLGTAFFARSAQMMAQLASALGLAERAAYYTETFERIRIAFRTFFLRRDGLLRDETQGAYLAAIAFGLLDADETRKAGEWLARDMKERGGITWGTATTPIALPALCGAGMQRDAVSFVTADTYPGLGYMRLNGATSVWERWDSIREGKFHPHAMNAFNHIGLATVGAWIVSSLAGIMPAEPGFKTVLLAPVLDERVGSVSARYLSVYGPICARWELIEGKCSYACDIPGGVLGLLRLPGADPGRLAREDGTGLSRISRDGTYLELLPGSHSFQFIPEGINNK